MTYSVKVTYDDYCSLEDAINDEPVMILGADIDQSKRNFPAPAVLRAVSGYSGTVLDELCDDWMKCGPDKFKGEHADWNRPRYFKTRAALEAAMFRAEYGAELSDLRVEQFDTQRDTWFLCFWQSELDAYAGCKNAVSCRDSCLAVVNGDVYGYEVIDDDTDETVESCWGFIGDSDYCKSQGQEVADYLNAKQIEASRPDMYGEMGA